MANHRLEIEPIGQSFGAEVRGVQISDLSDGEFARIHETFYERSLVVFRGQKLAPQDHIAFAERFAEININRFFTPTAEHPQIAEVRKEPGQTMNIGGGWHADHSYDLVPALGSILVARELPSAGGDTLFASMHMAWEALSTGLRRTLEGLRAKHSSRHVFGSAHEATAGRLGNPERATQDVFHPIGLSHPQTGRKALYVNPGFTVGIEGWAPHEAAALLELLYQHAQRPEFTVRVRWAPGTVTLWDNRSTWHYALNDYPGERRLMHRITLEGTPLEGSGAA